jgi:hypothetical protein
VQSPTHAPEAPGTPDAAQGLTACTDAGLAPWVDELRVPPRGGGGGGQSSTGGGDGGVLLAGDLDAIARHVECVVPRARAGIGAGIVPC